jgi:hypothetical protein
MYTLYTKLSNLLVTITLNLDVLLTMTLNLLLTIASNYDLLLTRALSAYIIAGCDPELRINIDFKLIDLLLAVILNVELQLNMTLS